MDIWEVGVICKSKFLQLRIIKCESSIDDMDTDDDADDADAGGVVRMILSQKELFPPYVLM